ncbi:MAG: AmmeMemoRadiSam system protein B [Gemmatimonadota bacterium]|nr:MAG: AmmeMemoRadiSam system protein B [Gemmatimonadota bacterium]
MAQKIKVWSKAPSLLAVLFAVSCCASLFSLDCRGSSDSGKGASNADVIDREIRKSVIAGSWYPGDREELSAVVDGYLSKAPDETVEGELVALIAPHAGYRYSGSVAAHALKLLRGSGVRTVVLLGPSHRHSFRGVSVYARGGYETPLGVVPINTQLAHHLISTCDLVSFAPEAHANEHSLEIQLPFLQRVLPKFDFVPVVIGPLCSVEDCVHLSEALVDLISQRDDVVLIASSDMSHYPTYDEAVSIDQEMLAAVESFDVQRLVRTDSKIMGAGYRNVSCTFCGLKAVLVAMITARGLGANAVKILKYANSGDTPYGDRDRVVGYGAVAVYQGDMKDEKITFEPLDEEAQQVALRMARETIETYVRTGRTPEYEPEHPVLNEKRGVFVTITKQGLLRGCIGYHGHDVPLFKLIPDRAIAAAVKDTRFPPLSVDELDDIEIKISVYLSNVYKIDNLDEFELGRHGIILTKGGRAATYLPEVPLEAGWTKEEEMEHLCRKAGLPSGAWRDGAELYVYATQVFGER